MLKRTLSLVLSVALVFGGMVASASAAVIGTQDALALDARQARIADVQRDLSRDDVQQAMTAMGVDPQQAQLRVASLSDLELSQLQSQLDSLPAGGEFLALIGAVFVVLLILELVGVINIFHKP